MPDYFDKEMLHLRINIADHLKQVLSRGAHITDNSFIMLPPGLCFSANNRVIPTTLGSATSSNTMMNMNRNYSSPVNNYPKLKVDKIRSMSQIVHSVGNLQFIDFVISICADTVRRMECVAKDDKRLGDVLRDVAVLELFYTVDGVMMQAQRCCTTLLTKHNAANNTLSMSSVVGRSAHGELPPMEVLNTLTTVYTGISKLKMNFLHTYMKPLRSVPNAIAVYKEHRRKLMKAIEISSKESLHAWTLGVIYCIEKILSSLTIRTHYGNTKERSGEAKITPGCIEVCKTLDKVITEMLAQQRDMPNLNTTLLFWKPLGQAIMGTLIAHIRQQKVTPEGGEVLLKDVNAYCEVSRVLVENWVFIVYSK